MCVIFVYAVYLGTLQIRSLIIVTEFVSSLLKQMSEHFHEMCNISIFSN